MLALSGCGATEAAEPMRDCEWGSTKTIETKGELVTTTADAVSSIAAFARRAAPYDRPPRDEFSLLHDESGGVEIERARRLVADAGPSRIDLYAAPTTTGGLCFELRGREEAEYGARADYGGLCYSGSPFDSAVELISRSPDHCTARAAGIVPTGVVAVEVELLGRRHRAELGENAFVFERRLERGTTSVAILLHYDDGTVVRSE